MNKETFNNQTGQNQDSSIWNNLVEAKEKEETGTRAFINNNFDEIVSYLAQKDHDDPQYAVLKKDILQYASPVNLMFNWNSYVNELNNKPQLSNLGFTPSEIINAVPDYYFPIYAEAMNDVGISESELWERMGFTPYEYSENESGVKEHREDHADEESYEDNGYDENSTEQENYTGETTREQFMKKVHDDFGPEEARLIAYAKRKPYRLQDGRLEPHPNWETYSTVTDVLPRMYESKEFEDVPDWDKWVKNSYHRDSEDIKQIYSEAAKYYDRQGREEKAQGLKQVIAKIDQVLEEPNAEPGDGWSSDGFPSTMFYQSSEWLHCVDLKSAIWGGKKVEARLYMHVKPDKLLNLVDAFKKKSKAQDSGYYFKISPTPRADNFLIFTNYEDIEKQLDILKEIKEESPELFESMDNGYKNPFWGTIDGAPKGIYFGEEPAQYPRSPEEAEYSFQHSYGSLRSEVFDKAFKKWMKEVYHEEETSEFEGLDMVYMIDGNHSTIPVSFKSPQDIPLSAAKRLNEIFREELDKADICPDNLCFDKYPDRKEV